MIRTLLWGLVVVGMCGGAAQGLMITVQDATPAGNDPAVQDTTIRMPTTNVPAMGDNNYGAEQDTIFFAETKFQNTAAYQARHNLFRFDVSALNDKPITSATFGFYIHGKNSSNASPKITGAHLSRFLAGKDWIEGVHDDVTATAGEVCWNWRKYNTTAWATAGGTGAADIDTAGQQTFDIAASVVNGELRKIERDVTSFVQTWTSGTHENNGMQLWGGASAINQTGNIWWAVVTSENPGGATGYKDASGNPVSITTAMRPYLKVEYTPEPASLLLLGLGGLLWRRRR